MNRFPARVVIVLFLCGMAEFPLRAQPGASVVDTTAGVGFLSVRSAPAGAKIFVDDTLVGTTPLDSIKVPAGGHSLRGLFPSWDRWQIEPVVDSFSVTAGESIVRELRFPRYLFVSSTPPGATVFDSSADLQGERKSALGVTPLWISLPGDRRILVLRKDGFRPLATEVATDTTLVLVPDPTLGGTTADGALAVRKGSSDVPVYLTAGAAILSGALAAYLKIKADHLYNDYQFNGDPAALDRIHRYDRGSGIALVACEINLVGLAYLLFRR